jgi:hypothetical protein
VKKSFNIQEPLQVQITSWNHAHAPLLDHRELSKDHQEHDLKHPGTVDLITTKENKLPPFIDRLLAFIINLHTLDVHCSRVYSCGNNLRGVG